MQVTSVKRQRERSNCRDARVRDGRQTMGSDREQIRILSYRQTQQHGDTGSVARHSNTPSGSISQRTVVPLTDLKENNERWEGGSDETQVHACTRYYMERDGGVTGNEKSDFVCRQTVYHVAVLAIRSSHTRARPHNKDGDCGW